MDGADFLYLALYICIAVFLGGLYFVARKREERLKRKAEQAMERQLIPLKDEKGFDQPIWQGKIEAIVADDERHEAEFDLLVYLDSVFIGFTEQGFPFVTLPAEQILKVIGDKGRVRILYRREDGREIYYQLFGKQMKGLTDKIEFIRKRACIR